MNPSRPFSIRWPASPWALRPVRSVTQLCPQVRPGPIFANQSPPSISNPTDKNSRSFHPGPNWPMNPSHPFSIRWPASPRALRPVRSCRSNLRHPSLILRLRNFPMVLNPTLATQAPTCSPPVCHVCATSAYHCTVSVHVYKCFPAGLKIHRNVSKL